MAPSLTLDRIGHLLLLGVPCYAIGSLLGVIGIINCCIAFFTLWVGASLFYITFSLQTVDIDNRAVLVTGCDSGFGNALARKLDEMGFIVFAGCLLADKGGEGAEGLKKDCSERLTVIQLDVTSEEEVTKARKKVDELMPKEAHLWGIVNNAGLGTFGDLEWVPLSMYKKITDVNVFGMINIIQNFLPPIRRSKGRIVNIASMLGRMAVPMRSPYCLTKFAVGGMSDCLRQEMKAWGVDVIVVEPGNYVAGTSIFTEESVGNHGKQMWENMSEEARTDYGEEFFNERVELMKSYVTKGYNDITPVVDSIVDALTQKFPQARYQPMDLYYKTRTFISWHFPEWLYDKIYLGCLRT